MAIYHCSVKIVGRSGGLSVVAAAAYRSGGRIVDERTGLLHDYSRKSGVDGTAVFLPAGAPDWMGDRAHLWNAVEAVERRKDSQLCREVEISLPVELSPGQQRDLAHDYAQSQFVSQGMVADVCLHHLAGDNPHAHVLLTMRSIEGETFGKKVRGWNDKDLVPQWREAWAETANRHLEAAGHEERIDHRSLVDQGIERIPQGKLGGKVIAMEKRGIPTERGDEHRKHQGHNAEVIDLTKRIEERREKETPMRTDRDIEAEIRKLESEAPETIAAGAESVKALAAEAEKARAEADQAERRAEQARADAAAWRKAHPVRTWTQHQAGIGGQMIGGRKIEAEITTRETAAETLERQAGKAERALQTETRRVVRQVTRTQAAPREHVESLRLELELRNLQKEIEQVKVQIRHRDQRQAEAEKAAETEKLQKEIKAMKAEKEEHEKRQAEPEPPAKLTDQAIEKELQESRLENPAQVAAKDTGVKALAADARRTKQAAIEAERQAEQSRQEAKDWKKAHPIQAGLGIGGKEIEQEIEASEKAAKRAADRHREADQAYRETFQEVKGEADQANLRKWERGEALRQEQRDREPEKTEAGQQRGFPGHEGDARGDEYDR